MSRCMRSTLVAIASLLNAGPLAAQTLGTFTWQLQPFCNVVVVTVTQTGGAYTLDGYDRRCGATQRAPAAGVAVPNADGSIQLALTIVTGGRGVHVDARLAPGTYSGPWTDSAGRSGTLALGADGGGSALPPATTLVGAAVNVTGAVTATSLTTPALTTVGNDVTVAGGVYARSLATDNGGLHLSAPGFTPTIETLRRGIPTTGTGLVAFSFQGSVSQSGYRPGARILATATQDWQAGNGASLAFETGANGSNTTSTRLFIDQNGEIGIGTTTPDQLLSVNGNASKVGGGTWAVFSDERLKTIHGPFTRGLADVLRLQPVRFEYRPDNPLGLHGQGEYVGFSAQAVRRVMPEAVTMSESGYLQVQSDPMIWAMVNAIKELKVENDSLRKLVESRLTGRH